MGPMRASAISRTTFPAMACMVLQTIVFLFTVVGTPIDVFHARSKGAASVCYSMWGLKECGNHKVNPQKFSYKGFPSEPIESTMNGAAAFAIMSIFCTLVALVLTVLLVYQCVVPIIPGIFSAMAFCTLLVCWACMVGVYNRKYSPVSGASFKSTFYYAGGFGLIVTAWCLQTVEMILVFA